MPDTKVQMNVTLTDGTVINAGQFTVPQGPAGPAGTGINWKGTWVAGDEVFKDDAYFYQGSSYVANKDNAAGPPTPVNPDWSLLAARGNDGADGVTPLIATGIASVSGVPIVNGTAGVPQATFNRKPVEGETCVLYVNYSDSNNLRKFYITRAEVTIAASICTVKFQSVVEYGIGIKSVSVVEVTV